MQQSIRFPLLCREKDCQRTQSAKVRQEQALPPQLPIPISLVQNSDAAKEKEKVQKAKAPPVSYMEIQSTYQIAGTYLPPSAPTLTGWLSRGAFLIECPGCCVISHGNFKARYCRMASQVIVVSQD